MRDRYEETVISNHGDVTSLDLITGSVGVGWLNTDYIGHVSSMRDLPSVEKHAFKPCIHMKYDVEPGPSMEVYHSADTSNAPDPRIKYSGVFGFYGYGQHLPPVLSGYNSYIPVTSRSTDDIADCVFNAYNQYINSVRSLDASQSIAELGETPHLFRIWQRRKGVTANLVNGFLNYSFGWRPVLSDLRAISKELRQFPKTVRRRLRSIGQGKVTRHYKFRMDDTVDDYSITYTAGQNAPYSWGRYDRRKSTKQGSKKRVVTVTIRANVRPKLTGDGQDLLNKLGALGLIPSLATAWATTRLSFVVDWFFNIGGAIENLQGSLTHDVSNVEICVTDKRSIEIVFAHECDLDGLAKPAMTEKCELFIREVIPYKVPFIPSLKIPRSPMKYVLLTFISLSSWFNTPSGKKALEKLDRFTNPNKGIKTRFVDHFN